MDRCRLTIVLAVLLLGARPGAGQVRVGIDVLLSDSLALVSGQRIGLLTTRPASIVPVARTSSAYALQESQSGLSTVPSTGFGESSIGLTSQIV